jgi:hypothetical protein
MRAPALLACPPVHSFPRAALVLFVASLVPLACLAACSSASTTAAPPPTGTSAVSAAPAASASAAASSSPEPGPPPPPVTSVGSEPPDAGLAVTNAEPRDAGASDRLASTTDVIKANREAFRACFDKWSAAHPGEGGKVVLVLELDPKGRLRSKATIDAAASSVTDKDLESCMAQVAAGLAFPASPAGKDTRFSYPFDFRPKR